MVVHNRSRAGELYRKLSSQAVQRMLNRLVQEHLKHASRSRVALSFFVMCL